MGRFSYQDDPGDELRSEVWDAMEFTPLQFFRVAAWKSAQGLGHLTVNPIGSIEARTNAAMQRVEAFRGVDVLEEGSDWAGWQEWESAALGAMRELFELDGVRYRMASAVLCFLSPATFPVVDVHTAWAVWGPQTSRKWSNSGTYARYTKRLVEVRNTVDAYAGLGTVHEVDQRMMNLARVRGTSAREDFTQLGFDAVPLNV